MNLFVRANTTVENVVIDYIEVEFEDKTSAALGWSKSSSSVKNGRFEGLFEIVLVGEDDWDASSVKELFTPQMQIIAVGLYDGENETVLEKPAADFSINDLFFIDDTLDLHLTGANVFVT